jgi:transcription antitermination factor NusG
MAVASLGSKMGIRNQQWPWFAVLTRTGREKDATLLLENSGYECYLPVSKFTRKWSDDLKEIEVPLFPGYLFCRMNPNNRLPVLTTPGIIQIVGVGKTPVPADEEEIKAIQLVGKSGLCVMPWPYMPFGRHAEIMDGPLRGLSGTVVKIKSGMKLVLSISLLERSVAVAVDPRWISGARLVGPIENKGSFGPPTPRSFESGAHQAVRSGQAEPVEAD